MEIILGAISPIAFDLFGWPVHWYGLIIGLGIVVAYFLILKEAKKKQIEQEKMSDLIFYTILIGFVGARLYYVAFKWDYYSQHLDQIASIWQGGIAIYGGILAGLLAIYLISKNKGLNLVDVLDIVAPGVMIAQAIGRWGNFINQEAYGYQVPKAFLEKLLLPNWIIEQMHIDGAYYHPTFLYESLWNFVGFIVLVILREQKHILKRGEVFALYLMWYGLGRMWIEGLRTDSLYLGPLRISQLVAILFVVLSVIWIFWRRKFKQIDYYNTNRI